MKTARFDDDDLGDELPAAGLYKGTVESARLRCSARGNQMVEVVYQLDELPPGHRRLSDYFVLEGASPRGLMVARRRLVELYRACNFEPRAGAEIEPELLVGTVLAVKLGHQERDGEVRLHVVGYRSVTVLFDAPPF